MTLKRTGALKRTTPLKRGKPMKRTNLDRRGSKPLKADPAKLRDWANRSNHALPHHSKQRTEEIPERRKLVHRVLTAQPTCEARIPVICTIDSTEVNEIIRRGQWADGYLIKSNTEALCHNCHAFITTHPDWAGRHGHQIEGKVRDRGPAVHGVIRRLAQRCRRHTIGRCDVHCPMDHREAPEIVRADPVAVGYMRQVEP